MKRIALGILAHVDSGKTTLSEAMLYCSGSIPKLGRVDHKNAFLDNFYLERSRGITIFSKQAVLTCGGCEFTLIDTPGHVDFSAECERTLQALDYAVLVISASDGVQSHTRTLWKLLRRYNVPSFIFVNKMDIPGADKYYVMREIREELGDGCVDFTASADQLYENIALCGEELLNSYYENETIEADEIKKAVSERRVFPCMFGSALKLDGVTEFLNLLSDYCVQPSYPEDFAAKVYKISEDKGDRLTHMKITGGRLRVKDVINGEKVNQIRIYSGEKYTPVTEAEAGSVCAVVGLAKTKAGEGLGAEPDSALPVLEPVLTYRVILPEGTDAHTALSKLRIIEAEDPQLNVTWNERLGEIQVQLMGDIQLEVLSSIVSERFGFDISFGEGNIIYKETISDTVEGVGHFEPLRHYAEVHLMLRPGKRDSGLVFSTDCKEDVLDKNWQRLILTHLYEKTHLGVLTGSPITDMEISLVSGRAHAKHTEGGDFREATYRAVRQGLRTAKSVLLEPVYEYTLEIPQENVGRAMSDIQRMCGSFESPEIKGDFAVIRGTAPVATMRGYSRELAGYSHGAGRLSHTLKGYEACHNPDEIIAAFGYDPDADTQNPCDSVFCSHGAGHIIKWNEVRGYMHVKSAMTPPRENVPKQLKPDLAKYRTQKDIFALDKELVSIFEQTYGSIHKRKSNSVKRRISAPEQKPYKGKAPENYDGEEYLLVDGYNVIFSWEKLRKLSEENIDGARGALINILCNYQGYRKCELIVVFDAYKVKGDHREVERVNNISVVYTREAETADMYIEKTSHKLAKKHRVRVVTSDAMEQLIILGAGALRVSSRAFEEEVNEAENEIRELISAEN